MTKRAILRRQCIRAKRTLMRRWPNVYYEECFTDAGGLNGDELEGTPIYWCRCGEDEYDQRPAVEELRNIIQSEKTDWERLTREMLTRERFAAMPSLKGATK